jgi:adenylate kinase
MKWALTLEGWGYTNRATPAWAITPNNPKSIFLINRQVRQVRQERKKERKKERKQRDVRYSCSASGVIVFSYYLV